jgi:hypothetical protein
MKNLIIFILCMLALRGCSVMLGIDSDSAYKECMEAGQMSEETCKFYAYQ